MKRLALIGASLVLVGGFAAACGDDDKDDSSGSTTASLEDFCAAMETFLNSEDEDAFNENKDKMKDVGTPEEIDGAARDGFEFLVDIDWDDRNEEPDADDLEDVTTFVTKYGEVCTPDLGGTTPEETPSE